jgi:uncharacterized protein
MSQVRTSLLALATVVVSACSASGPPPELYVLGNPTRSTSETVSQLDHPIVEVKRVRVPDYLDTTDIVARLPDGRLVARATARWGERLSVGLTRVVAGALEARLPRLAVTTAPPIEPPQWQLLIDIDELEVLEAGQSVLIARWTLREGQGGKRLREEKVSLATSVGQNSDKAIVAAMNRQIDQLVDRIVDALEISTSIARRD